MSDEEKDARDYQLQRAMEMVIAMGKMKSREAAALVEELMERIDSKRDK